MADQQVKIVVSAEDKASAELKKVNKELGGIGTEAKTTGQKFSNFWTELSSKANIAIMAFETVARVAQQMYTVAREGAELDFLASKFDNLTASIGTTSEALLRDLRGATDGTLSDMELMGAATDFLSLGLAKSHDEVVRLSTVSSQLGMDMNQLVLTLTNQTTMRFDALGVSVSGFDEKVQKLKDSGMDANAAFTEAFLQQAEQQIERVGSATEESIGSFMRLETAWKNAVDTAKRRLVPAFAAVAESFANMLTVIPDNVDQLEKLNDQVKAGKISYDEYKEGVDDVLDSLHIEIDAQGNLTAIRRGAEDGIEALKDTTILLSEEQINLAGYTDAVADAARNAALGLDEQTIATEKTKDATNNAESAMRKYNDALLFKIASEGLSEEAALALAQKMGLVDQATVYATEKVNTYAQLLEDKKISQETYTALVEGLRRALAGMPENVNIDLWLKMHGYDEFQRVANAIGSGSMTGGEAKPIMEAAGGPVRPGQTVVVGESGPEILQMGQNGGHIYPTNVTNNFNLGVTTLQNANSIQTAFAIMQAMA